LVEGTKFLVFPYRGADGRLGGRGAPHDPTLGKALFWPYRGPDGQLYMRGKDKEARLLKAFPYRSSGRLMFRARREPDIGNCEILCGSPAVTLQPTYKLCLRRFSAALDGMHEVAHDASVSSPCTWRADGITMTYSAAQGTEATAGGHSFRNSWGTPDTISEIYPVDASVKARVSVVGSCRGPSNPCNPLPCDKYCGDCLLKTSYTICLDRMGSTYANGAWSLTQVADSCTWTAAFSAGDVRVNFTLTHNGSHFILTVTGSGSNSGASCAFSATFHSATSECWRQAQPSPGDNPHYPMALIRQSGVGTASIVADSCVGGSGCTYNCGCENPVAHRPTQINLSGTSNVSFIPGFSAILAFKRSDSYPGYCENYLWTYEALNCPFGDEYISLEGVMNWGRTGSSLSQTAIAAFAHAEPVGSFVPPPPFATNVFLSISHPWRCGCKSHYGTVSGGGHWSLGGLGEIGPLTWSYSDPS
jgi:hypothetical protein